MKFYLPYSPSLLTKDIPDKPGAAVHEPHPSRGYPGNSLKKRRESPPRTQDRQFQLISAIPFFERLPHEPKRNLHSYISRHAANPDDAVFPRSRLFSFYPLPYIFLFYHRNFYLAISNSRLKEKSFSGVSFDFLPSSRYTFSRQSF